MAPFDDWNNVEEDDELEDTSFFDNKKGVVLFAIDCSSSMFKSRPDLVYEDQETNNFRDALEAVVNVQRKKVTISPNDSVGIMLYNVNRKSESTSRAAQLKRNCYVLQPLAPLSAPSIQVVKEVVDEARGDLDSLRARFPLSKGAKAPLAEVLLSCSWIIRDGAPKTAEKRIFLITDDDDPCGIDEATAKELELTPKEVRRSEDAYKRAAETAVSDLRRAGVGIEPFFIGSDEKPFDYNNFYEDVLGQIASSEEDEEADENGSALRGSQHFVDRVGVILAEMQFREVPKRALFSIPFELGDGFKIGVKGYGLITEQKKGAYKYFKDTGDRMEVATSKTSYGNSVSGDVDKKNILFGTSLGAAPPPREKEDDEDAPQEEDVAQRVVNLGQRPFFTAEEVKSFRTLGLEPGIKLLGFKDKTELAFEDNVRHSYFIYPDEGAYSGSKRTFTALLNSMVKKGKMGIVRATLRSNATPLFCALWPQLEVAGGVGSDDTSGFHLIALPFADDLRSASVTEAVRTTEPLKKAAREWINKLIVKSGYIAESYPNPALEFHNAQVESRAFDEEFDPSKVEDQTLPALDGIHKKAGALIADWKTLLEANPSWNVVNVGVKGSTAKPAVKRKVAERDENYDMTEIESRRDNGTLSKMTVPMLKDFLKAMGVTPKGNKPELLQAVEDYLDKK